MMKNEVEERAGCVYAALETGARVRAQAAGGGDEADDPVKQTIATIEAETARIRAYDVSALEGVLTSQALALDALFVQLARGSAYEAKLWPAPLRLALKAQSQSRATLSSLASLIAARRASRPK